MVQSGQRPRYQRHTSRILRQASTREGGQAGKDSNSKQRTEDDATVQYIKRVLCPKPDQAGPLTDTGSNNTDSRPFEELLPPLTSSNEADVELYAIIAVILSQFVQSWYNRITPDNDFVTETVQIIAHCTRGVEERLRQVDLEDLLLDEIPALVTAHIESK